MGHRTLKRVPLGFSASLHKVWEGYINPYPGPLACNLCDGSGYNTATKQIADDFYAFDDRRQAWCDNITQDEVQALVDEGRLMDFTHTWKQGEGWKRREDGYIPTAEEVNVHQRKGGLGGHDAINRFILIEARAKRLGVFGKCPVCKGEGTLSHPNEAIRKLHEEWKEYEPPTGVGYQLWETCSEGSPISPVFATAEELANWCTDNATIFADEKTSRANWLKMFVGEEDLDTGSLMVMQPGFIGALANAPKQNF